MNEIAAPARLRADERDSDTTVAPAWTLKRIIDLIVGAVIRRNEDDIAKRYEGSAWCDSIEHDLNNDIMTGRRTRSWP
jgi:hypothetical protein